VYWLLASTGICVVPLSGFASDLPGFRFTLLEHDDEKRRRIYTAMGQAVRRYLGEFDPNRSPERAQHEHTVV
jgi:aspartate/methionine/tyrosine aminotransferase